MISASPSSGWIYAFKDRGFDRGIKIGRDRNRTSRYEISQCYSPRGIELVALWHVDAPKIAGSDSFFSGIETKARSKLKPLHTADGGAEWIDATADDAIDGVSAALGIKPEATWISHQQKKTYDDFRSPKDISKATRYRQLLWAFRENQTGRIKLQRSDMWNCALRERRTYSRLGFPAVKCWGFEDPKLHVAGNGRIHEVWKSAVDEVGYGAEDLRVGWLRDGAEMDEVEARSRKAGLVEIDISRFERKPAGIRPDDYRG